MKVPQRCKSCGQTRRQTPGLHAVKRRVMWAAHQFVPDVAS